MSSRVELSYGEFAQMLYATGVVSDPWLGGKERFRLNAVVLTQELAAQLNEAAERVGAIYHELTEVVLEHPELLDEFFWHHAVAKGDVARFGRALARNRAHRSFSMH